MDQEEREQARLERQAPYASGTVKQGEIYAGFVGREELGGDDLVDRVDDLQRDFAGDLENQMDFEDDLEELLPDEGSSHGLEPVVDDYAEVRVNTADSHRKYWTGTILSKMGAQVADAFKIFWADRQSRDVGLRTGAFTAACRRLEEAVDVAEGDLEDLRIRTAGWR